jgi:hypothetical protein
MDAIQDQEVMPGERPSLSARTKRFFIRHEKRISSVALVLGFIVDNITFAFIEISTAALALAGYLVLAAAGIALINMHERTGLLARIALKIHPFLAPSVQFSFGALFSAFTIFYSKSGSLTSSWPFMLMLVGLLVGNEFFRRRYLQMTFQAVMWFVALLLYAIFLTPILIGSIGVLSFVAGTIAALAVVAGFLFTLARIAPARFNSIKRMLAVSVVGVYIGLYGLYFTNLIPPIPLSLREIGVYHAVERLSDGGYALVDEDRPWYEPIMPGLTIHTAPNEPVYIFSAVFAPSRLTTPIVHRWQYYNEVRGEWVTTNTLNFSISGGRQGGFRGYTYKTQMEQGKWRVSVETTRGQVLGDITFTVERVNTPVPVEVIIR